MPLFATLNRLKADLDALRPLAPEQERRVLQKFRLEWNYNSNAIEGNSLTLGETRSLLLHGLTAAGKPMRDHLDIKGHNEAVLWLEDFVRSQEPLTEYFIRSMHQLLLGEAYDTPAHTPDGLPTRKRIVPGQYKTSPNNVLTATGEMFYFASPEETSSRMTELVDWYRQEEAIPTIPPVALAADFHYRFVRIHPFDDGNGRMSRLLMNLILLRHGYPMTVIKAADRNRYLAALSEADAGEFEPFLRFIIENVEAGLRLMIRAAQGESIDEPDDLDKKLALLKKQVLSHEEFKEITWNAKTQTALYIGLLRFWFADIGEQMARFNELFQHFEIGFDFTFVAPDNVAKALSPTFNLATALSDANGRFESADSRDLLSLTILTFRWNAFRGLNSSFNQMAELFVAFKDRKFSVEFTTHHEDDGAPRVESVFSSGYKTHFDLDYIHIINRQLATKVYDFIAAKVAEVDSPPS